MEQIIHSIEIQRSFLADKKWKATSENVLLRKQGEELGLVVVFLAYSKETCLFLNKIYIFINWHKMSMGNMESLFFLELTLYKSVNLCYLKTVSMILNGKIIISG